MTWYLETCTATASTLRHNCVGDARGTAERTSETADRSAVSLVHGDLVGGEYGRDNEPRPPPNDCSMLYAADTVTGQTVRGGTAARP